MVCFHPIEGYRTPGGQVAFAKRYGWQDRKVTIPCGQCQGCRLERSRQVAIRIMHEASLYEANVFLTLTYRDECLPENDSLELRDWQLFMKRLKKRERGRKIRFYHCGEYGETTHRPHYHAILFNTDFPDKVFLKKSETGLPIYKSDYLDEIWRHGDCYIGSVTFESAAYCGRYVMKKLTGSRKSEYGSREPEYATSSLKPGIGAPWLLKWKSDVYPHDYCVINGLQVRVPKYYDQFAEGKQHGNWVLDNTGYPLWMPNLQQSEGQLRQNIRIRNAAKHSDDNTPERLAVREELTRLRIERLTRS